MNFNFTVPFSKLLLLLRRKVLISEKHNTSLRNKQSQFISLLISEILQLKTLNLSSDVCSQISDFSRSGQKALLRLVSSSACIDVIARLVSNLVDIIKIQGARRTIGIAFGEVYTRFLQTLFGWVGDFESVFDGFGDILDAGVNWGWDHFGLIGLRILI